MSDKKEIIDNILRDIKKYGDARQLQGYSTHDIQSSEALMSLENTLNKYYSPNNPFKDIIDSFKKNINGGSIISASAGENQEDRQAGIIEVDDINDFNMTVDFLLEKPKELSYTEYLGIRRHFVPDSIVTEDDQNGRTFAYTSRTAEMGVIDMIGLRHTLTQKEFKYVGTYVSGYHAILKVNHHVFTNDGSIVFVHQEEIHGTGSIEVIISSNREYFDFKSEILDSVKPIENIRFALGDMVTVTHTLRYLYGLGHHIVYENDIGVTSSPAIAVPGVSVTLNNIQCDLRQRGVYVASYSEYRMTECLVNDNNVYIVSFMNVTGVSLTDMSESGIHGNSLNTRVREYEKVINVIHLSKGEPENEPQVNPFEKLPNETMLQMLLDVIKLSPAYLTSCFILRYPVPAVNDVIEKSKAEMTESPFYGRSDSITDDEKAVTGSDRNTLQARKWYQFWRK